VKLAKLAATARDRAHVFSRERFMEQVRKLV
jgi:hypothetical protein